MKIVWGRKGWAIAAALLCSSTLHAQNVWEKPIAPGLVYRMEVDETTPRVIHALRLTLRSPSVKAEPALAGRTVFEKNETKGRATVSQMVEEGVAIGGINGDYFPPSGDPLGLMLRQGAFLSNPWPNRSGFGWGDRATAIAVPVFEATAVLPNGETIKIDGINRECGANEVVLNTPDAGLVLAKAPTISALLATSGKSLRPHGRTTVTVDVLVPDTLEFPSAPDKFVLTANGNRTAEILKLRPKNTVTLDIRTVGFDWARIANVVGGGPRLLANSQKVDASAQEGFNDAFSNRRHPRTAVGTTADGDIWFVAVDGRQTMSAGATLPEMAELMRSLGCTDALNLDGGGSTTLNLFGLTLNRPSDGRERAIANGILLKSHQPANLNQRTLSLMFANGQARVADGVGSVPNIDVIWSATGDAWIDQGGFLRWLKPGRAVVSAYVSGQKLSLEVVSLPPPPKVSP